MDTAADRAGAAETDRLSSSKADAVQPAEVQAAKLVMNHHAAKQEASAPYAEKQSVQLLDSSSDMIHQALDDAEADSADTASYQVRVHSSLVHGLMLITFTCLWTFTKGSGAARHAHA